MIRQHGQSEERVRGDNCALKRIGAIVPCSCVLNHARSPLSALSTKLTALDGADGPALGSSREEGTEEEEPEMEPEREPDREEEEEEP
jgi:hypothetical protein